MRRAPPAEPPGTRVHVPSARRSTAHSRCCCVGRGAYPSRDDDQSSSSPIDFGGGLVAGSRSHGSPSPSSVLGLRPSGDVGPTVSRRRGRERGADGHMDILISGAGIAGLTTAYWLRRYGFTPTIVERAPSLVTGGYKIDVRGTALGV